MPLKTVTKQIEIDEQTDLEESTEEEQEIVTPAAVEEKVELVDPTTLKVSPKNQQIYGDEPDTALLHDIKLSGIREPLVCDKTTGEIVSGRRRHLAALHLKLPLVPVIRRQYGDEDDRTVAIVQHNAYRSKSQRQIMFEVEAVLDIERRRARERKSLGGKRAQVIKHGQKDPGSLARDSVEPVQEKPGRYYRGVKVEKKLDAPVTTVTQIARSINQPPSVVNKARKIIDAAKKQAGQDGDWTKMPVAQAIITNRKTLSRVVSEIDEDRKFSNIQQKLNVIGEVEFDLRLADNIDDIEDKSVDCIITDPEYQVDTGYRSKIDKDSSIFVNYDYSEEWFDDMDGWAREWARVLRDGGNIAVFCPFRYVSYLVDAMSSSGFESISQVIWHRTNPEATAKTSDFIQSCECVVVGCLGLMRDRLKWLSFDRMHNFIDGPGMEKAERIVDAKDQKPEYIIKWIVERMTSPGDMVLDNFAGSGTTGVVCRTLKRQFALIERDQRQFDIAKIRLSNIERDREVA